MRTVLIALAFIMAALPALAAPCPGAGKGPVSIHFDTGKTALTDEHRQRLTEFADVAKHSTVVCIFAQVDAQGTEAANRRVAEGRAESVRAFLVRQGVPADRIKIAKAEKAVTFFGLLGDDRKNDRRVTVSHD